MGMKHLGNCGHVHSRGWRVESVNSVEVKERPADKSRVFQGEKESLPGIRGMVAKRMPSLFNPSNM